MKSLFATATLVAALSGCATTTAPQYGAVTVVTDEQAYKMCLEVLGYPQETCDEKFVRVERVETAPATAQGPAVSGEDVLGGLLLLLLIGAAAASAPGPSYDSWSQCYSNGWNGMTCYNYR